MRGLPKEYWYLWLGTLINRLGGFVILFLAIYLNEVRGFSTERAGLVVALAGGGTLAAAPVGGLLADRFGRRPVMLSSTIGGALAMIDLGFARAPLHVLLAAPLVGFLGDLYRPASAAAIADLVPPADRTRAFGYLYWAVNLGFSGAAVIAGALARKSFSLLFIGDAATTLVFGAIVLLRVGETNPVRATGARKLDLSSPLRDRDFMALVVVQLLVAVVFFQFMVALALDMRAHGISTERYGSLNAINGVLIVLVQPFLLPLIERASPSRVLALASVLVGAGFGMNALVGAAPGYAVGIAVWTLGEIGFSSVLPTLIANLSPADARGAYQGVAQTIWGAAIFVAPLFGAAVLEHAGARVLWGSCFALGLVAAALHLWAGRVRRQRVETEPAAGLGAS